VRKNRKDLKKQAKQRKSKTPQEKKKKLIAKKMTPIATRETQMKQEEKEDVKVGSSKQTTAQTTSFFTPAELEEFKKLLLDKKSAILSSIKNRESDLIKSSKREESGELSSLPQHLAEMGSQEYDKGFTFVMLEVLSKELKNIETALEKIQKGTYGICDNCGNKIAKERLMALPSTNLCLNCKMLEENSLPNQ
jgi:RNA polymerase-binding protein DksA